MKILIKSLPELASFAKKIQKFEAGRPIALIGELGAGKTAFSKLFLRAAGIQKNLSSPTFVLMHAYRRGRKAYYHIDLYRTKSYKEIRALGIPELWQSPNNTLLIEWADKIRRHLPKNTMFIKFKVKNAGSRQLEILNASPKMAKIINQLNIK